MRFELILAGILLLSCALPVKLLWDRYAFQRLVLGVNILWGVLVAFHYWPAFQVRLAGFVVGEGLPLDAIAFWAAFALACLPGWAFTRWGLRDSPVDLPLFLERATGIVLTVAVALLLPCLVVMTVAMLPLQAEHVLPAEGVLGRSVRVMRQAPVQFYLRTAAWVGGMDAAHLSRTRLPHSLRAALVP
ncbi:MAG: hypothetical protein JXR77_12440 [Lentisphaeria bacterium]|nr:hypothetical protein [Lentisphaeria bacterium]